jgi:hypothetical protein
MTNSSSEIFILDNKIAVDVIEKIIKDHCKTNDDIEWYNRFLHITMLTNETIEVYSIINGPDWLDDILENEFNVIRYSH